MAELAIEQSPIPGLLVVRLELHEDARGWFKENWQRERMTAVGLPDFDPVQNNVALSARGVTRGLHAEPWDKYVSVAHGRVFAAWVDLREGPSFGTTYHLELDPGTAVFVPRGVGNAYQALEPGTVYTYLVNAHWRPDARYTSLHPGDSTAAIPWPIPLEDAEVSAKDRQNPTLDTVVPVPARRTLVLGGRGQLGRALLQAFPQAEAADLSDLDVTDTGQVAAWPWAGYEVVLNATGYTAVDDAETPTGRRAAWLVNAQAPATLAQLAREHRFTLVHYSTDYVFDGTREIHDETEPLTPLGVYGQSKAAGELAVSTAPRHYLLRTSWLIGDGHNFVRTMAELASRGASPRVVADQVGRLTFTDELARATRHLLETGAEFGTYNCSNDGPATSWADVATQVFEHCGRAAGDVTQVSTEEYIGDRPLAPRPHHSVLDLTKLRATGYEPADATEALKRYLDSLGPDAGR